MPREPFLYKKKGFFLFKTRHTTILYSEARNSVSKAIGLFLSEKEIDIV